MSNISVVGSINQMFVGHGEIDYDTAILAFAKITGESVINLSNVNEAAKKGRFIYSDGTTTDERFLLSGVKPKDNVVCKILPTSALCKATGEEVLAVFKAVGDSWRFVKFGIADKLTAAIKRECKVSVTPDMLKFTDSTETNKTEAPVGQAEYPVGQTESPVEPVEVPVEQNEVPVEETEAPVEPVEAPAEPVEAPAEQTESPVEQTEAHVEQTETPVGKVEAPVEETDDSETDAEEETSDTEEETPDTEEEDESIANDVAVIQEKLDDIRVKIAQAQVASSRVGKRRNNKRNRVQKNLQRLLDEEAELVAELERCRRTGYVEDESSDDVESTYETDSLDDTYEDDFAEASSDESIEDESTELKTEDASESDEIDEKLISQIADIIIKKIGADTEEKLKKLKAEVFDKISHSALSIKNDALTATSKQTSFKIAEELAKQKTLIRDTVESVVREVCGDGGVVNASTDNIQNAVAPVTPTIQPRRVTPSRSQSGIDDCAELMDTVSQNEVQSTKKLCADIVERLACKEYWESDDSADKNKRLSFYLKGLVYIIQSKRLKIQDGPCKYWVLSSDKKKMLFNSKLIDRYGNYIYLIDTTVGVSDFYRKKFTIMTSKTDLVTDGFSPNSIKKMPEPLQVSDNPGDYVFNATIEEFDLEDDVHLNHIINERKYRFPDKCVNEPTSVTCGRIRNAIESAIRISKADPRYILPIWSIKEDRLSFAIPLHIDTGYGEKPELMILVAKTKGFWKVFTVLSTEAALANVRLVTNTNLLTFWQ